MKKISVSTLLVLCILPLAGGHLVKPNPQTSLCFPGSTGDEFLHQALAESQIAAIDNIFRRRPEKFENLLRSILAARVDDEFEIPAEDRLLALHRFQESGSQDSAKRLNVIREILIALPRPVANLLTILERGDFPPDSEAVRSPRVQRILLWMHGRGDAVAASDIAKGVQLLRPSIYFHIRRLLEEGIIQSRGARWSDDGRVRNGLFSLVPPFQEMSSDEFLQYFRKHARAA